MQFDIRTLLVAVALATGFCAAARILLWRMHPTVPGLLHWAVASILGTFSLLLFAARGWMAGDLGLSLSQMMIAGGFVATWHGFRLFLGRRGLTAATLAVLAVAVLAPLVAAHLTGSVAVRSTATALVVGTLSGMIARELLTSPVGGAATRATAYIYFGNAVFFATRAVASLNDGASVTLAQSAGFPALALLWWLCVTVAVTLGMALMTSERLQADLDRQASRDPLTGTLNRRAFSLVADKVVARARRSGRPLSVLMMDLDHFKQVNDQLGHAVGDDVLRLFVAVADRVLRSEDTLCRFGGEEFVALLPDASAAQALAAGERLRLAFSEEAAAMRRHAAPSPFAFTVSLGIGEMQAEEDLEATLRRADAALYHAKAGGRNRCALARV